MTLLTTKKDNLFYVPSPIATADGSRAVKSFRRIHGGIAWGDPASDDKSETHHAVVIAGEDESYKIVAFKQFAGKWADFLEQLIILKDTMLVQTFWIPPSSRRVTEGGSGLLRPSEPTGLREQLYDLDGLTRYKPRGRNRWRQPIFLEAEPAEKWPTFRTDLPERPTAIVCDYDDRFLVDFESSRLLIDRLVGTEIGGDPKLLAPFEKASHQKPSDTIKQPIFRAFVGVCWQLWQTSEKRRHAAPDSRTGFPTWEEYQNV